MLTDFHKQKFTKHFNIRDINKDGYVEMADYAAFTRNVATLAGWSSDAPQVARLQQIHAGVWQFFWLPADNDGDSRVTLAEHLEMMAMLVAQKDDPNLLAESQKHSAGLFAAFDFDGDGQISKGDYQMFLEASNVDSAEWIDHVFGRLDSDQDGFISQEEFGIHHFAFFTSDDPNALLRRPATS